MWAGIVAAAVAVVLIPLALLVPTSRLVAGIILLVVGFIGTASVMAMFIGLPMMLIGIAIIAIEVFRRREARRAAGKPPEG